MPEKDTVFSSKIKYGGVFSFQNFYKFCYDWLSEEDGFLITEDKYAEKISGDAKNVEVKWTGVRKVTDYFRFDVKIEMLIVGLKKVEVMQGGNKIKTNEGSVEMKVKGVLVRDYNGKFETSPFNKFIRAIYEKWVIPGRIEEFQDKLMGDCDEFLSQSKAYLDLEGKK